MIGANAVIAADATVKGDGGRVIVWADESAAVHGRLSARGGAKGGDGGLIETSAKQNLSVTSVPDVTAPEGAGGTWLIDPNDIDIVAGSGPPTNIDTSDPFAFPSTGDGASLGVDLIEAALSGGANVTVTTSAGGSELGNINLNATLALDDTNGTNTLTFSAHNDININSPITDTAQGGETLNLVLEADSDSDGLISGGILIAADIDLGGGLLDARTLGSGIVSFTDNRTIDADFRAGSVTVGTGTQTFNGNTLFDTLTLTGGTATGSGSLTVVNDFDWSGGTLAIETGIAGGAVFDITGTSTKTLNAALTNAGNLTVMPGASGDILGSGTLTNLADRIIDIQNDLAFAPTLSLLNLGILRITGGTAVTLPALTDDADAVVELDVGTLTLAAAGTHAGSFTLASGTTLRINAPGSTNTFAAGSSVNGAGSLTIDDGVTNFDAAAGFTATGTVTVNGGTIDFGNTATLNALAINNGAVSVSGSITTSTFTFTDGTPGGSGLLAVTGAGSWSGGTMQDAGETRINAGGSLSLTGTTDRVLDTRVLTNLGTIDVQLTGGAGITLVNAGAFDNEAGGTLSFSSSSGISGTSGVLTNRGTVAANADTAIDANFINAAAGALNILNGTLTLTLAAGRQNSNEGRIDLAAGTTLVLSSTTPVDFTNAQGAELAGHGTLDSTDPDVTLINAGRLDPGSSPGTLTFDGGLTLTGSSVLKIDTAGVAEAGTDYDLVRVIGNLTLGGTVEMALFGGYIPALNDTYAFITQTGTRTGSFAAEPIAPLGVVYDPLVSDPQSMSVSVSGVGSIRSWITAGSGNWNDSANWSDGGLLGIPGAADIVHINQPGTITVTVSSNVDSVLGLDSKGILRLTAGTLTLNGTSFIETLTQSGGLLTGDGLVTVTDTLTWTAGRQAGTGATQVGTGADLLLTGSSQKDLDRTLRHFSQTGSSLAVGTGQLDIGNGGAFVNETGATMTWDVPSGSLLIDQDSGGARVVNRGLWVKRGTGQLDIGCCGTISFTNEGTVRVEAGLFDLARGGTQEGLLDVRTGGELRFGGGTHVLGANFAVTGAGLIRHSSGTVTVDENVVVPSGSRWLQTGGTLNGDSLFTVDGSFEWQTGLQAGTGETVIGVGGELLLTGASQKDLDRTLRHFSTTGTSLSTATGQVDIGNGGAFVNEAGATMTWDVPSGSLLLDQDSGGATVVNRGLWVKRGAGELDIGCCGAIPFDNASGAVTVEAGLFDSAGGSQVGAMFTVLAGGEMRFSGGTHDLTDAVFSGDGRVRFAGGTSTLQGALNYDVGETFVSGGTVVFNSDAQSSVLTHTGGVLRNNALLTINDTYDWRGGQLFGTGETVIPVAGELLMSTGAEKELDGHTLTHRSTTGTSLWSDGNFRMDNGAVFTNAAGALFEVSATTSTAFSYGSGSTSWVNEGTLTKSGALEWEHRNEVQWTGTGDLTVTGGFIDLRNVQQVGGTWDVAAGTRIDFLQSGNNRLTDTVVTGEGRFRNVSGTLTLDGTTSYGLPRLDVTGGTLVLDIDVTLDDVVHTGGCCATTRY